MSGLLKQHSICKHLHFCLLLTVWLIFSPSQAEPIASKPEHQPSSIAIIETNLGNITIALNSTAAPITTANFINYANSYFYDGLIFHRVVKDFMIQTGGYWFDYRVKEPTGETIINESANGLKNRRGSVAMARYQDPDSARAQFFINLTDNSHLDATDKDLGYTVFGQVISGMDVADKIGALPIQAVTPALTHVPIETVQIQHIAIEEAAP
ncbi:peptidylprolyl isomerase [bacterium SCSIO 12696]|nr:peptidylprolyl isomerase [bacterium SCSIO 12696]